MFNYAKLKGRIVEYGYSNETLSEAMGFKNRASLYNRLNNKTSFTQEQIADLMNLLDIPKEQICDYFFAI